MSKIESLECFQVRSRKGQADYVGLNTFPHVCRGQSIASEWDMICGQAWKTQLPNIGFFAGQLLGTALFTQLAGAVGRLTGPQGLKFKMLTRSDRLLVWGVTNQVIYISVCALSLRCMLLIQNPGII